MANPCQSRYFPPADSADPDGLLGVGGRLSVDWLLDAYAHGIFPWPVSNLDDPMPWWSPEPRAIFELDGFHISRSLRRVLRSKRYDVTCDQDFAAVIRACAEDRDDDGGTWITPRIIRAYCRLFEAGHAHSVEAWHEGQLVGGVYGVAIKGLFAAESKFHRATDASKVALAHLVAHLRHRGYLLLDIQQLTSHTARLGAIEISRAKYLHRLSEALKVPVSFGDKLVSSGDDWSS